MSTSYTDPRGSTLSLENPRRQTLTGSSFSLQILILSKADAKMMSVELPLSTRTMWIVLLATMAFITSGSSWGCWQPSMSKSEKVMVLFSRGSLDTVCTSKVSLDLMLLKWAFLVSWTLHLLQTLRRTHGFLLKMADAELGLADEVVVAGLVPALLSPRNGRDAHIESSIQFPFLAGCNHLFSVHDPYGTHSIWYRLF